MTRVPHFQTHLYSYASALWQGDKITPDNLAGTRVKALAHGHSEAECQAVERDPHLYIRTGRLAPAPQIMAAQHTYIAPLNDGRWYVLTYTHAPSLVSLPAAGLQGCETRAEAVAARDTFISSFAA